MAQIPTPLRAALGLVANAIESARTLPDKAVELPVIAVSTALQFSLRAQQRYTELALRGDELLSRLHGLPDEPPGWATFDDQPVASEPAASEPVASEPAATEPAADEPDGEGAPASQPASATKQPRARMAATAKKTPDKKAAASKAGASKAGASKAGASKAAASKAAASKAAASKAKSTKRADAKTVHAKRTAEPSAFDVVGEAGTAPGTSEG